MFTQNHLHYNLRSKSLYHKFISFIFYFGFFVFWLCKLNSIQ